MGAGVIGAKCEVRKVYHSDKYRQPFVQSISNSKAIHDLFIEIIWGSQRTVVWEDCKDAKTASMQQPQSAARSQSTVKQW